MAVEAQSVQDLEMQKKQAEADAINGKREGVGTRVKVGRTRGKGSVVISFEEFDTSKPNTLPTTPQQFIEITKANEATMLDYLIRGFNDASYEAASDPLAEFVEDTWPTEAQTQFRLVVRNYARGANVSLEEAVNLIKPGFVKQFSK